MVSVLTTNMHGFVTVSQSKDGKPKAVFYSQVTAPETDMRGYLILDSEQLRVLVESIILIGDPTNRFGIKNVNVKHDGENVKISWPEDGIEAFCLFRTIGLLTQLAPGRVPMYLKNIKELDRKKSKQK